MVKTVGKYDLYGTLGEGAFGKVKYAVNTETNEAVAIKILDKDKIQTRNMGAQIKKEISIMKMINHHHVVCVKDVFATSAKIFIVLEFVGGGELFDKIANEGKLSEGQSRFYFKQLVNGLEHCHNNGICHRDLKPENLLLDTDGNLKISDFGFSTLNIGDADGDGGARAELLHTTCGTPNYVAPEVLGKDGYDGKIADVWSIGVILFVLLAGYLPFDENTMVALFQKIKNAEFEYPAWFSAEAKDLISKTLVPDPGSRIKLSEMKLHPWMDHPDSGPTPSKADHSSAMSGAPAVTAVRPPAPSQTLPAPPNSSTAAEEHKQAAALAVPPAAPGPNPAAVAVQVPAPAHFIAAPSASKDSLSAAAAASVEEKDTDKLPPLLMKHTTPPSVSASAAVQVASQAAVTATSASTATTPDPVVTSSVAVPVQAPASLPIVAKDVQKDSAPIAAAGGGKGCGCSMQ